jgi:DNA-binding response OmpR family regulator
VTRREYRWPTTTAIWRFCSPIGFKGMGTKGHGYDVVRAFDDKGAMGKWRETRPAMMILDAERSRLDGFEVCRRRWASPPRWRSSSPAAARRWTRCALDLGADDYPRKPCSSRQLLARIRSLAPLVH